MIRKYLPNILSLTRVALAGAMYYYLERGDWPIAVLILWLAVASDLLDGFLARKFNSVSSLGGVFDHGSDAIFATSTIAALVSHGFAPLLLAIIIPAAFLQYMLDSKSLSGQALRSSFVGRYNGIAYYVFAGFPIMQITLGLTLIPFDWFIWIGWGLVMTTAISMVDRMVTLFSNPGENQ